MKEKKLFDPGTILNSKKLIIIVGNYGSGKTEVAVNLAIALRSGGVRVRVADLDIVNPYFRCREAMELMRVRDIGVVVPPGEQVSADLPIVVPEIAGMLAPQDGHVGIFDVGGDDVGARLLSSFAVALKKAAAEYSAPHYELWQVINARRPFTDTVEGCLKMRRAIENASRLNVTGLIGNTHLMHETDAGTVYEGWELTRKVADASGLPIVFVTAMKGLEEIEELEDIDAPLFYLKRYMLPPWLAEETDNMTDSRFRDTLPAPRSVPIGRPSGVR